MARSGRKSKKNNGGIKEVRISCLGCGKFFFGKQQGDPPNHKRVSSRLTVHLNTDRRRNSYCFETYNRQGLVECGKEPGKVFYDFSTSPVEGERRQSALNTAQEARSTTTTTKQRDFRSKVREQIGLPTPSRNFHQSINNQTIFTPGLHFDKSIVDSLLHQLEQDTEEGSADGGICNIDSGDDSSDEAEIPFNQAPNSNATDSTNSTPVDRLFSKPSGTQTSNPTNSSTPRKEFVIDSTKKLFTVQPSDDRLRVEIDLLHLMAKHKMPLAAFDSIWRWAHRNATKYKDCFCSTPRKRETVIGDISRLATETDTSLDRFQPTSIDWLPSKKKVQLHVRSFKSVLKSLLTNTDLVKEHNLSFPDPVRPYIWRDFPEPDPDTEIRELHHGNWWVRSWRKAFTLKSKLEVTWDDTEVKDILVPVIFYMDGISLDANGRLSLMPLNMTLGIFKTEARKRPDAWETVYFQPNQTEVQIAHNSKSNATSTDKYQNLHNGLAEALESFFQACAGEEDFIWVGLPYGGKTWKVRMRFAIAYVVGDSELHDQLCGRKKVYTNTKILCRHCNVCQEHLVNPLNQVDESNNPTKLWMPEDFHPIRSESYFEETSHNRIVNAFDRHNFGSNQHKIHLATPGELLHMHQLGPAKRAVEAYKARINGELSGSSQTENVTYLELCKLAQVYGGYMRRQSDRDFPRTSFSTVHILKTSMKEGSHYSGILLTILLSILSDYGKNTCMGRPVNMTKEELSGLVETIELIIAMEEFLKKGGIKIRDLSSLDMVIVKFLENINTNCKRNNDEDKGFGVRLLKNHLYLHIVTLLRYFGVVAGWDSSFPESHHSVTIKAPSRNTQCRPSHLIKQTGIRQFELRLIREAARAFLDLDEQVVGKKNVREQNIPNEQEEGKKKNVGSWFGPSFTIFVDEQTKEPRMVWDERRRHGQPTHCEELLKYCVDHVLVKVKGKTLRGYTEHHRVGDQNGQKYIYRAHPSFRSNVGLRCNQWYDWAYFNVEDTDTIRKDFPGHIMCFLEIKEEEFIEEIDPTNGFFCVTREFKKVPAPIEGCRLVKSGTVDRSYSLRDCDAITDDVAVVPNIKGRSEDQFVTDSDFFVVGNRNQWLRMFWDRVEEEGKNTTKGKRKRSS